MFLVFITITPAAVMSLLAGCMMAETPPETLDKADVLIRALGRLSIAQERGAAPGEVQELERTVLEARADLLAAQVMRALQPVAS